MATLHCAFDIKMGTSLEKEAGARRCTLTKRSTVVSCPVQDIKRIIKMKSVGFDKIKTPTSLSVSIAALTILCGIPIAKETPGVQIIHWHGLMHNHLEINSKTYDKNPKTVDMRFHRFHHGKVVFPLVGSNCCGNPVSMDPEPPIFPT